MSEINLADPQVFSEALYERMQRLHPGVADLELYEFRYCLENVNPSEGWNSISLDPMDVVEQRVNDLGYYQSIQIKPREGNRIVMDAGIMRLLRMLFVGLVTSAYPEAWVNRHFYFDLRGFFFLHRTEYYSLKSLAHLGGRPYRAFEQKQSYLEGLPAIGYKAFKTANDEVDGCFIDFVKKLVDRKGAPILVAIGGQTAAGKTEIVARLRELFEREGKHVTSIEVDHFFKDRDYREAQGIDSLGKEALHYDLLLECLTDIRLGKKINTPRYDFLDGTSSHDLEGNLKQGGRMIAIEPADIIFMEGNSPFLLPDVAPLIGIKVAYLTDDAVRLKRKWRRDMDYRKKYDMYYFLNRYFREQFIMAEKAYIPQMEVCDLLVDTTRAAIWTTAETKAILERPA